jgi:hypothetical protein
MLLGLVHTLKRLVRLDCARLFPAQVGGYQRCYDLCAEDRENHHLGRGEERSHKKPFCAIAACNLVINPHSNCRLA